MRVLLTGTADQVERLAARLREEGFEPVECPLIETVPLGTDPIVLAGFDWLVLTSRSGVEYLFARLSGRLPKVAAIGPGTAEALEARGVVPDLVPPVSTQEGLAAAFPRPAGRVLFLGAEGARHVLVDELGAEFRPLYRTVERLPAELPGADLAVLASGSAARALARAGGRLPCVSIGPATTAAALEAGLDVEAEAAASDLDGLVEAVRLAGSRRSPTQCHDRSTGSGTPPPRSSPS
jgi:uroporphyrinogen-III synthase